MALLAFALRKYQKELYNAEVGVPITADNLRDRVMELFSFWQNGKNESKLRVRFGSKEEKELIDTLIAVFDLKSTGNWRTFKYKECALGYSLLL